MFLLDDGKICWSATDLTRAVECEYALVRGIDVRHGAPTTVSKPDPFQDHLARLGDLHEGQLLCEYEAVGDVVKFPHLSAPFTPEQLASAHQATLAAFAGDADVIYQATFFDGEYFGYADFIESTRDGWLVCDAKLARQAKPKALLQLAAYADQLSLAGVDVAPTVALLLGDGTRAEFPLADIWPVFDERRTRLRQILAERSPDAEPVRWRDERYLACGKCVECAAAAETYNDVLLVAGIRSDHRRHLTAAGITTMAELAVAKKQPDGITKAAFAKIGAQAALQWAQSQASDDAALKYELLPTAGPTLDRLPSPSQGDLFFDFEGDPLYDEGDRKNTGLEYLWGAMDEDELFTPLWAHNRAEEKQALVTFITTLQQRLELFPDLHVYHYAAYEKSALTRMAARHQVMENEIDALLRAGVFVDLYATVRGAVRVAASSYSIKKLEPLYMGTDLRESDVSGGAESVLAYHEYRALLSEKPEDAAALLKELLDYNCYDCLSTLRLRDWLLARRAEAPPAEDAAAETPAPVVEADAEEVDTNDAIFVELMARSGPDVRTDRTPDEQANAMLAAGLNYFKREHKQFWWEHYARLDHPLALWEGTRDVFSVESALVDQDWAKPEGKARNFRRVLRLTGDWAAGSKPGGTCLAIYATPEPPGVNGPEGAPYGAGGVQSVETVDGEPRTILLTESRKPADVFGDIPVALAPTAPPNANILTDALARVAAAAVAGPDLPDSPALDLLRRQPPRLFGGGSLPSSGDVVADVVAALTGMTDSYVAIQGPPGTGKTHNGSRVIKELVEKHHWRIGIVAQSHAVVENMLAKVVEAGLDPALVGKSKNIPDQPTWSTVPDSVDARAAYLTGHTDSGCVLGGTAWTFANDNMIEAAGLDLLVIDEAGQFALAPTLAAGVSAQRLLLLGDPQQLPQVSQGVHPEPVNDSALGWLLGDHDTIPAEFGYFLGTSYRMHSKVCAKVSRLSYEDRLVSAQQADEREMVGVDPGVAVVRVPHEGCRTESAEEAQAVVEQVAAHLGMSWRASASDDPRRLVESDFLVVAPYNAQVAVIRKHLLAAGYGGVLVGTVDLFQGKEAPIAMLSMTASSHGDVPRGMGFLLNRNRVNVAVSRAQWKAILIRSDNLTAFMPTSTDGLLELGAFIGLSGSIGSAQP